MVKNLPANVGDLRDVGPIPGLERSPGGGLGNSLQYSCLQTSWTEHPDRLTLHNVAQNQTRLKQLSMLSLLMSPLKALSTSSSVFYL